MDLGSMTGLVLPGNEVGFLSFKAPVSVKGGSTGFSEQLLKWGNSHPVIVFWAVVGCICSFLCPVFLFLKEGQAVGDIGPVRLLMMLLSCILTGGVYRIGFLLRDHRIMREEPSLFAHLVVSLLGIAINIVIGVSLADGGTWPTVIGLELVAASIFVFQVTAKPVHYFHMLQFFPTFPIIAGLRRRDWEEFVSLGWPILTFALASFFIVWRSFFLRVATPVEAGE